MIICGIICWSMVKWLPFRQVVAAAHSQCVTVWISWLASIVRFLLTSRKYSLGICICCCIWTFKISQLLLFALSRMVLILGIWKMSKTWFWHRQWLVVCHLDTLGSREYTRRCLLISLTRWWVIILRRCFTISSCRIGASILLLLLGHLLSRTWSCWL